MFDLLEKSFLLGLGALSITKTNAEKFVDEAIKQCKITPEEGTSFLKTFEEEGIKARQSLEDKVIEIIKTHGESLFPNKKTVEDLEKKVAELEAKINAKNN